MKIKILPFDSNVSFSGFDCGVPALNTYLSKFASQNELGGISSHYLAVDLDTIECVGFYAISMSIVESEPLPEQIRKGLPKHSYPAGLIGRLAASKRHKGNRIGEQLLVHAIQNVVSLGEAIGCFAIVVDAKDDVAEKFYLRYGFNFLEASRTQYPRRLYLTVKDAKASFGSI